MDGGVKYGLLGAAGGCLMAVLFVFFMVMVGVFAGMSSATSSRAGRDTPDGGPKFVETWVAGNGGRKAPKVAKVVLKGEISDIAVLLASKVTEREISASDHEALIDGFIDSIGDAL